MSVQVFIFIKGRLKSDIKHALFNARSWDKIGESATDDFENTEYAHELFQDLKKNTNMLGEVKWSWNYDARDDYDSDQFIKDVIPVMFDHIDCVNESYNGESFNYKLVDDKMTVELTPEQEEEYNGPLFVKDEVYN